MHSSCVESIDLETVHLSNSPRQSNRKARLTSLAGEAAGAMEVQNMLDEYQLGKVL